MVKWVTFVFALLGVPVALWAVVASRVPPPALAPDEKIPVNPFPRGISAPGAVEAASRNVRVAAPEPGLIEKVFVQVNDVVKAGDPLFQLDTRLVEADLAKAEAALEVSRRSLDRLRAMPRPDEVARLQAALNQATARADHKRRAHESAQRMHTGGALSAQKFGESDLALNECVAEQAQAQAALDLVRAGTSKHDLLVSEAELRLAEAELRGIRSRRDRLTVRSPIAGTVLKRYLEPGQFAPAGDQPSIMVGDLSSLRIRAQVDERDAQRLHADCRAVAFGPDQTGGPNNLRIVRIEPLAVPKNQLSASTSELVDVRVIEVVFELESKDTHRPFYPGQVVDVFIDANSSR
jgi:HlyD family secretion protein